MKKLNLTVGIISLAIGVIVPPYNMLNVLLIAVGAAWVISA